MELQSFPSVQTSAARSLNKPRRSGLTLMVDFGIPLQQQADLLEMQGQYVDYAHFAVGTPKLYAPDYLRRKLDLYRRHQVRSFIGGQFCEYVFAMGGTDAVKRYCAEARSLGFDAIEVSDNRVTISDEERVELIRIARTAGLGVLGEVGSKSGHSDPETLIRQAADCFDAGAELVLIEAAEIIDGARPNKAVIDLLASRLEMNKLVFELTGYWLEGVTQHDVYALRGFLVKTFGPDVNLANLWPEQVWDTEALRAGLSMSGPPGH